MDRSQRIIRTSILGIASNLVLVAFKAAVGLISGSIAVLLDAVNNFSDALSSVITIIGTRLAGKAPDKKHPYGYGRIEYLTSVIIAVIVLFAGVTSLKESVEKIIHPTAAEYTAVSLVIIVAGIAVKLLMGRYVKRVGESINAGALIASGSDALFDAVLSAGTLVAAVISLIWGLSLEGIIGAVISVFILKAGIGLLMETLNSIIGTRAEKELTDKLKQAVMAYPQVKGVYDMTLHNYGPTQIIGSVHVELPDEMTAKEIHRLTRGISADVFMQYGIVLTVGIYASNTGDETGAAIRASLDQIVSGDPRVLQVHGFYVEQEQKTVTFDLVVDFSADRQEVQNMVCQKMSAQWPDYRFNIVLDSDYSD